MAPISKSSTATWTRKPSHAMDFRYGGNSILHSDGNSSNYSSGEENPRFDRKHVPSFMLNDEMNGRSYVDPWDMENYSFLRRQLEDVNISDSEINPALESSHSDFYYVPLDTNGSPQYQYKHYVDSGMYRDGFSTPFTSMRSDCYGLVANIDEHDFYNDHLDTPHHSLLSGSADSYLELSNPSRQSERSRFNNQDYQTYMPPSIIKDSQDPYESGFEAKAPLRYFSDLNLSSMVLDDRYDFSPGYEDGSPRRRKNVDFEVRESSREAPTDPKVTLNRRKSFHEMSADGDVNAAKHERRRKSVLDHPHAEDVRPVYDIGVPDYRPKEGVTRRKSIHEFASGVTRLGKNFFAQRIPRKSSENYEKGSGKEKALADGTLPRPQLSPVPESSLVYVYETPRRRRKMVLPTATPRGGHPPQDPRFDCSGYEDGFVMDPMDSYIHRPVSRYTMTTYGHLKIDYSCSWNCLDKYIAHRIRT